MDARDPTLGPAAGEPAPPRRRPAAQATLERDRRRRQFVRAAVTGLVAGALAILFKAAVVRAHLFGDAVAAATTRWGAAGLLALMAVTAALGAAAAWATGRFAPEAGGSGIPHVKAVLLHARAMRPVRLLLVKFGCGFAALAAGMSLGREGPTVQMGAAVGKLVGQVLRVRRRSVPALVAAGAGAGLAAAFNAPLAGFLFVMEELKREMSTITYGTALVGSVCAVAVSRMLTGQGPSFLLESAGPVALRVLPLVALFGALAGLVGVLFNNALVGVLALRDRWRVPRAAAGATIGALAGLMMVVLPDATGVGHDVAQRLLAGRFTAQHLVAAALLVCGAKFALTVLSYGTGVPGGIFAPLLVIGAFLGYACGALLQAAFPALPIVPVVFATIGMAAVLAGSVRAPLTGVVLIFEMTSEYGLLYALLLGAFAAYAVAEALGDTPIYERLLARDLHGAGGLSPSSGAGGLSPDEAEPVIVEVLVEPDSRLDGVQVREIEPIAGALVATVQRGARHIVPKGSTLILAGDVLTIVVEGDAPARATTWFEAAARHGAMS